MDPNDNTPAPMAGRREWIGLAVLALPGLLLSVDGSVLFLAIPRLSVALNVDSTQQLWITDVYGFMLAGFLVTMGRLGDLIGRRRLLVIGAVCFGLLSVLAAYSTSAAMLIAARALLGVAGATIMPSALALIGVLFPNAKQQGMAVAVFISCVMAGAAIGPVVGGVLLNSFWWGSVFLLGVPVMLLLVVAGPVLLPEFRNPGGTRLDVVSVVLYLIAILPLIYGINELGQVGWQPGPLISLVVGLVFAVVFLRRQRRVREPLLDLDVFRHRAFSTALAIGLFSSATMSALGLFFSQFVQVVKGWSPLSAGLLTVLAFVAMVSGTMLAPMIVRKVRPGTVLAAGLGFMTIGFLLISRAQVGAPLTVPVIGLAILCVGAGSVGSVGISLVVGSVPPEKAGSAASVSETTGELGGALGIATLGSIATAIYRSLLHVPSGVPSGAGNSASESISRAAATAADLPRAAGTALFDAAKSAFTTAFQGMTIIAAILAAGMAVLALVALRQAPPSGTAVASGAGEEPASADTATTEQAPTEVAAPLPISDVGNG
ncbi:MAG: transporter [Actinomycetia bacterium]|nr:transporter [Actinomycetes bacterium]